MHKDQIKGLVVATVTLIVVFFSMGGHSTDKKAVNNKADKQLVRLNQWFDAIKDLEHDNNKYVTAITGCSRDNRTLVVDLSKEYLEDNSLDPEKVASYAFNIIQTYPGDLSAFDNVNESNAVRKSKKIHEIKVVRYEEK